MANLHELMTQNEHLETQLEDAETFTEELEKIWEDTQIELRAKIDAYGFVLDSIVDRVSYLKKKKQKINDIQKHLESEIERIKARLNNVSQGQPLRGNEYSFHPFTSVTTDSINMELVEPEKKTYTVSMNYTQFCAFSKLVSQDFSMNNASIEHEPEMFADIKVKLECKVSDLPEGHPAVIKKITPSVRMK